MNINFCQNCASPVERHTATEYKCPACGQFFWNNPHASVAVALIKSNLILVSKRAFEPRQGTYDLPGGFLEFNESVFDGAKRELMEEAGMSVDDFELISSQTGIYDENDSFCDSVLIAHTYSGEPKAADDSAELVWKPFSFLKDPQFSPEYPGLFETLMARYQEDAHD